MHNGLVPPDHPVVGGDDVNGEKIYCGRAIKDGDVIPGKVVQSHGCCYVAWGGKEHAMENYQVLCNPRGASKLVWVDASNGEIPLGALVAGKQSDGTKLYFGRTYHEGSHVVGKVHPEHGCLYFPFGGNENSTKSYEVLVLKETKCAPY